MTFEPGGVRHKAIILGLHPSCDRLLTLSFKFSGGIFAVLVVSICLLS